MTSGALRGLRHSIDAGEDIASGLNALNDYTGLEPE